MTAVVVQANAHTLPLPDASVDLVVTSPPYFALRSYTDGGVHYLGQIGAEAIPAEFIRNLIAVTAECMRVLKPSGSMFVNLGDKYVSHEKGADGSTRGKSLMLLPERYRIACIDRLGLIVRAVIVWDKPNGLPESIKDRVRRSHEDWVHLTKEPRYYAAVDEIREAYTSAPYRGQKTHKAGDSGATKNPMLASVTTWDASDYQHNPRGKLPGSVWTIATAPLTLPEHLGVDHFAAFPPEWPKRIIAGWSPREVCTRCQAGRLPVVVTDIGVRRNKTKVYGAARHGMGASTLGHERPSAKITGYRCACPDTNAASRPSVVLDPFGGTGTTAMVASALGRTGISVDLSHDYSRVARWRTQDGKQRARVLGVDPPAEQCAGQDNLFGDT